MTPDGGLVWPPTNGKKMNGRRTKNVKSRMTSETKSDNTGSAVQKRHNGGVNSTESTVQKRHNRGVTWQGERKADVTLHWSIHLGDRFVVAET